MPKKVKVKADPTLRTYYVYKHFMIHCLTGEEIVFYIGRGKHQKGRSLRSIYNRSSSACGRSAEWNEIASRCDWYSEVIADNLVFKEATTLENKLVKQYGRLNMETGSLVNLCCGGEGTPDVITYRRTVDDNIQDHVAFAPYSGCWIWLGSTSRDGRPTIHIDNKSSSARLVIYEHTTGITVTRFKSTLKAICDCSDCVNPLHMKVIKHISHHPEKKITEDDERDASRLLKYFYPSQIAYLFPHITPSTLKALSSRLKVDKVKIEQDWETIIENQSTKHLTLEDFVDMKRLHKAGIGSQTISIWYNLHRTKVTGIVNGYRGMREFNKL